MFFELKNIKKYFPVHKGVLRKVVGWVKAVDDVSLNLEEQKTHAVVGESGSGKSTLGRVAIRLIDPTAGSIILEGKHLENLTARELMPYRHSIQMIFQDPYASLNPRFTILESIGEGLLFHKLVKNETEKKEAVAEVLKDVGLLPDVMMRYPHQFSGGQQQRLCIARSIALKPKLLVCDEAVSALDLSVQAQILNLLVKLQEDLKLSYLFISHDLMVVRHISDQITVMYLGKVMEQGRTEDIFNYPKHPYTIALLGSTPKQNPKEKKERIKLKGEIPSPMDPPSGCPFRTRCPFAQPICAEPPPIKKGPGEGHTYACILD